MLKSSSVFLTLGAIIAPALIGVAAVPVVSRDDDIVVPPSVVLQPAPHRDPGLEDPSSLDLLRSDSFFWTHEAPVILANLTVVAKDDYRLLNAHRFAAAVHSVECSASAITITFNDADGVSSARAAWSWVEDGPENRIVYVVDDGACGGRHGRQPYYVGSVAYDAASRSAVLAASAARWQDFSADASIRLRGDAGAIAKRDADDKVPVDLGYNFAGRSLTTGGSGIQLTADCVDCRITGGLDFDIGISLSEGFEASLTTTNGFGFRFAVALGIAGTLSAPLSRTWNIVTFPLAGIAIGDWLQVGPAISVQAELGVARLSGRVTTEIGMAMAIPDGQGISLGHPINLAPQWSLIGPSINGNITAGVHAAPLTTLSFAGSFFSKGVVVGLLLAAPIMRAEIGSAGGNICADNGTGRRAVSYKLNVGMELDSFAGPGGRTDRPNRAVLYSMERDFLDGCVPITL